MTKPNHADTVARYLLKTFKKRPGTVLAFVLFGGGIALIIYRQSQFEFDWGGLVGAVITLLSAFMVMGEEFKEHRKRERRRRKREVRERGIAAALAIISTIGAICVLASRASREYDNLRRSDQSSSDTTRYFQALTNLHSELPERDYFRPYVGAMYHADAGTCSTLLRLGRILSALRSELDRRLSADNPRIFLGDGFSSFEAALSAAVVLSFSAIQGLTSLFGESIPEVLPPFWNIDIDIEFHQQQIPTKFYY